MSVILETKQLCKFYGAGENQVKAVNQVDIQIEQGEFVAIVGKSGSGKSIEHPGKTVCIATHGCAIRNFLCYAGGKPIEELNSVEWCDNTAVSVVEYDDSFVPHIVSQNDASHLNPEVSTFEKQDWWRPEKKKGSA